MSKTYKVVFTSRLQPDISKSEATKNVSKVLNLSIEKAESLLSRKNAIVINKNLSYELAQKYEKKLVEAGMEIKVLQQYQEETAIRSPKQSNFSPNTKKAPSVLSEEDSITTSKKENTIKGKVSFFKGWIINFVLAIIMAALAGVVVGIILGIVSVIVGMDKNTTHVITTIAGIPCGLISSFYFYRWSINKYILPQVKTF